MHTMVDRENMKKEIAQRERRLLIMEINLLTSKLENYNKEVQNFTPSQPGDLLQIEDLQRKHNVVEIKKKIKNLRGLLKKPTFFGRFRDLFFKSASGSKKNRRGRKKNRRGRKSRKHDKKKSSKHHKKKSSKHHKKKSSRR